MKPQDLSKSQNRSFLILLNSRASFKMKLPHSKAKARKPLSID
jgi:hypothetical protein